MIQALCGIAFSLHGQGRELEDMDPFKIIGNLAVPNGSIVISNNFYEYPYPAKITLHLAKGKRLVIKKVSDLRGHVSITNNASALEFLRLWSAPNTYLIFHYFRPLVCEIMPISEVKAACSRYVSERIHMTIIRFLGDGPCGILSDERFRKLNISKAKVSKEGNGYKVTRTVLIGEISAKNITYRVERRVEFIEKDGKYKELSMIALPELDSAVWWDLRAPH